MNIPRPLQPLEAHGVDFEGESGDQLYGTCPFCGKTKFYAHAESGQWDCKAGECQRRGNAFTFLQQIWEFWLEQTRSGDYKQLAQNRGLTVDTLMEGGAAWDGDRWLLPVLSPDGTLVNLRTFQVKSGQLLNTKGLKSGLFGAEFLDEAGTVWLCEGEWDALALRQLLAFDEGVVVAAPGAGVWKNEWTSWLRGRDVVLCYDHDEAGYTGRARVREGLEGEGCKVRELVWPEDAPAGTDVRDFVRAGGTRHGLFDLVQLIRADGEVLEEGVAEAVEPWTFDEAFEVYDRWLKMTPGITAALRLAWATVLSSRLPGDPLWLFLVAPPGGCKTELLMPLVATDECVVRSTLTPHSLVSGFRLPGGGDPSLLPLLANKTFVLKDWTEIQQMPQASREEVYAVLRGAYDGRVEKSFGNGITRIYECHFSLLAGATHHVQADRTAALGERFLMYRMGNDTTATTEDVIRAAMANVTHEDKMRQELGGAVARFLATPIDLEALPELTEEQETSLVILSQLVSQMRAQVVRDYRGEDVLYRPEYEVGTRIAKQLKKLAQALSLTEDSRTRWVSDNAFALCTQVGLDSATQWHRAIVEAVAEAGDVGQSIERIQTMTNIPRTTLGKRLEDLELLGVLDHTTQKTQGRPRYIYTLGKGTQALWDAWEGFEWR